MAIEVIAGRKNTVWNKLKPGILLLMSNAKKSEKITSNGT
jgi:hypothetical protein